MKNILLKNEKTSLYYTEQTCSFTATRDEATAVDKVSAVTISYCFSDPTKGIPKPTQEIL